MRDFWDDLSKKVVAGTANNNEIAQYNKLGKAFYHLSLDPYYPDLIRMRYRRCQKGMGKKCFNPIWKIINRQQEDSIGRMDQIRMR